MPMKAPQAGPKGLCHRPTQPLSRASAQVVWIANLTRGPAAKNHRKQL